MTAVTATKRRLIGRDVAGISGTLLWDAVVRIANRHNITPLIARDVIAGFGVSVETPPERTRPVRVVNVAVTPAPVDPVVIKSILAGSIYRRLSVPEPGENPSEVFVLTTLSQWKRERAAIAAILKAHPFASVDAATST